ncbi:uncharacterized protein [Watersipora subatra]|uniref:uncharacterized protein n=1 Tax=Watersipora subatra TaxID=2589382 RepID=UPI00355B6D4C
MAVYVDDLIIMSDDDASLMQVKHALSNQFKMKDFGPLHYCLGVNIDQHESSISLDQQYYLQQVINRFGMQDSNPVSTPADINVKLIKYDGISKPVDSKKYQAMVGSLLYASVATCPDIAQAISEVSKYNSCPTEAHLTAVKRIICYIKGTLTTKLCYNKSDEAKVIGYSDANWARDLDNRCSTSGNVFLMSGGAVSWQSKRQNTVAVSTAEAEYVSLFHATQEAMWLHKLLNDNDGKDAHIPTTCMVDNQAAIAIAKKHRNKIPNKTY